jgi:1,4-dihydroxy-2-naphthoyl-CoA hydrolase
MLRGRAEGPELATGWEGEQTSMSEGVSKAVEETVTRGGQGGFNQALALTFVSMRADEVIVEMPIGPHHHQPMGIVHGGVYCALVETVCSVGANLYAQQHNRLVVGVDNHTSFLRAQRSGTLRVTGRPLVQGKRTQLWEANVENDKGELVATGRVRLVSVEAGSSLAGEPAAIKNVGAGE